MEPDPIHFRGLFSLFLLCVAAGGHCAEGVPLRQVVEDHVLTENVFSQEAGEVQLLSAYSRTRNDGRAIGDRLSVGAEYGLSDRLQMETSVQYQNNAVDTQDGRHRGLGDFEIGFKYALTADANSTSGVAVGVDVQIAHGDVDAGLSDGQDVVEPFAVVATMIDPRTQVVFGVTYGLAFDRKHDRDEPKSDELSVGIAMLRTINHAWHFACELLVETELIDWRAKETEAMLAPGVHFTGFGALELAAAVPVGLTADSTDWQVAVQATWEIE